MNSLWSKFAKKWTDTSYNIKVEENCEMENNECHTIFDIDYFLVKGKQKKISTEPI